MSDSCYFCDERDQLESHHIVPRRFDGSDNDENLVDVCPTCHTKLERLYDKRFYDALGVSKGDNRDMPACEFCGSPADDQTSFLMANPPYSVFRCDECAAERGWA